MNKIAHIIALLLLASASVRGQEPAPSLGVGTYLLVYQLRPEFGMSNLKISVTKNADGALTISSADAPYTPLALTQVRSTFQFGLVQPGYRDEKRGTEQPFEALYFVGHPKVVFTEQNNYKQESGVYTGTMASISAQAQPQSGVSAAASGTFLLFKLPQ